MILGRAATHPPCLEDRHPAPVHSMEGDQPTSAFYRPCAIGGKWHAAWRRTPDKRLWRRTPPAAYAPLTLDLVTKGVDSLTRRSDTPPTISAATADLQFSVQRLIFETSGSKVLFRPRREIPGGRLSMTDRRLPAGVTLPGGLRSAGFCDRGSLCAVAAAPHAAMSATTAHVIANGRMANP